MVGVWTGCGFDTINIVFPPQNILGYDRCVGQIVQDGEVEIPVEETEGDEVFVIL